MFKTRKTVFPYSNPIKNFLKSYRSTTPTSRKRSRRNNCSCRLSRKWAPLIPSTVCRKFNRPSRTPASSGRLIRSSWRRVIISHSPSKGPIRLATLQGQMQKLAGISWRPWTRIILFTFQKWCWRLWIRIWLRKLTPKCFSPFWPELKRCSDLIKAWIWFCNS